MDDIWKLAKTIAGSFAVVYIIQGGWFFAKELGKREAYDEMAKEPTLECDETTGRIMVNLDGKKYYMKLEKVDQFLKSKSMKNMLLLFCLVKNTYTIMRKVGKT